MLFRIDASPTFCNDRPQFTSVLSINLECFATSGLGLLAEAFAGLTTMGSEEKLAVSSLVLKFDTWSLKYNH